MRGRKCNNMRLFNKKYNFINTPYTCARLIYVTNKCTVEMGTETYRHNVATISIDYIKLKMDLVTP